jgi:hypothetical protein
MKIVEIGRADNPSDHSKAIFEISPLHVSEYHNHSQLPVAAMPAYRGEHRIVYRAKRRPLLILGNAADEIPRSVTQGKPRYQTSPTYLVAPYYGVDEGTDRRSGYPQALIKRVRQCEYPQLFWDKLPLTGADESLLRFDHIQPISTLHSTIEFLEYRLSDIALNLVDQHFRWHFFEDLSQDELLYDLIDSLRKMPGLS